VKTHRGGSNKKKITPLSIILLKKLTGPQLVKKFPAMHWTRRFIIAFTSARPSPRPCEMPRNIVRFYGEALSAYSSIPKLEDHPVSAVRDCVFNIFAATVHTWRPFLHPLPGDAPCCGDRDPFIMVVMKNDNDSSLEASASGSWSLRSPGLKQQQFWRL